MDDPAETSIPAHDVSSTVQTLETGSTGPSALVISRVPARRQEGARRKRRKTEDEEELRWASVKRERNDLRFCPVSPSWEAFPATSPPRRRRGLKLSNLELLKDQGRYLRNNYPYVTLPYDDLLEHIEEDEKMSNSGAGTSDSGSWTGNRLAVGRVRCWVGKGCPSGSAEGCHSREQTRQGVWQDLTIALFPTGENGEDLSAIGLSYPLRPDGRRDYDFGDRQESHTHPSPKPWLSFSSPIQQVELLTPQDEDPETPTADSGSTGFAFLVVRTNTALSVFELRICLAPGGNDPSASPNEATTSADMSTHTSSQLTTEMVTPSSRIDRMGSNPEDLPEVSDITNGKDTSTTGPSLPTCRETRSLPLSFNLDSCSWDISLKMVAKFDTVKKNSCGRLKDFSAELYRDFDGSMGETNHTYGKGKGKEPDVSCTASLRIRIAALDSRGAVWGTDFPSASESMNEAGRDWGTSDGDLSTTERGRDGQQRNRERWSIRLNTLKPKLHPLFHQLRPPDANLMGASSDGFGKIDLVSREPHKHDDKGQSSVGKRSVILIVDQWTVRLGVMYFGMSTDTPEHQKSYGFAPRDSSGEATVLSLSQDEEECVLDVSKSPPNHPDSTAIFCVVTSLRLVFIHIPPLVDEVMSLGDLHETSSGKHSLAWRHYRTSDDSLAVTTPLSMSRHDASLFAFVLYSKQSTLAQAYTLSLPDPTSTSVRPEGLTLLHSPYDFELPAAGLPSSLRAVTILNSRQKHADQILIFQQSETGSLHFRAYANCTAGRSTFVPPEQIESTLIPTTMPARTSAEAKRSQIVDLSGIYSDLIDPDMAKERMSDVSMTDEQRRALLEAHLDRMPRYLAPSDDERPRNQVITTHDLAIETSSSSETSGQLWSKSLTPSDLSLTLASLSSLSQRIEGLDLSARAPWSHVTRTSSPNHLSVDLPAGVDDVVNLAQELRDRYSASDGGKGKTTGKAAWKNLKRDCGQLAIDLALSSQVLSNRPIPLNGTITAVEQEGLTDRGDEDEAGDFIFLRPFRKTPSRSRASSVFRTPEPGTTPDETQIPRPKILTDAASLLLKDWEVGETPSMEYVDPYNVSNTSLDLRAPPKTPLSKSPSIPRDQGMTWDVAASQPTTSIRQPRTERDRTFLPFAPPLTKEPPPITSPSIFPSNQFFARQEPFPGPPPTLAPAKEPGANNFRGGGDSERQMQMSMSQDMEMSQHFASTQVLPGPHGGTKGKPGKRKRVGGF